MQSAQYYCSPLIAFVVILRVFKKVPNCKFHRNIFSGNHASTCGRKDGQRQTDIAKLLCSSGLCECAYRTVPVLLCPPELIHRLIRGTCRSEDEVLLRYHKVQFGKQVPTFSKKCCFYLWGQRLIGIGCFHVTQKQQHASGQETRVSYVLKIKAISSSDIFLQSHPNPQTKRSSLQSDIHVYQMY